MPKESWPYKTLRPILPMGDYVAWLDSTDLPNFFCMPGRSACMWRIQSLDGSQKVEQAPKISRRDHSDEKRALGAALIGVIESVGPGSLVLIYAPGNYIIDGVYYAETWRDNSWRNSTGIAIKNPELWDHYLKVIKRKKLEVWTRRWHIRVDYKDIRKEMRAMTRAARKPVLHDQVQISLD